MNAFISGFISTLVCHPLEFLKVNYQNNNRNNRNIQNNFKKGLFINSLTYGLHYSIYYPIYTHLNERNNSPFMSAFIAQNISNILLNPLWVIRTQRMATDKEYSLLLKEFNFRNTLYRGLVPNALIGIQTGISFGLLEYLNEVNNRNIVINSFISKTVAGVLTYPIDTVRTIIRVNGNETLKDIIHSLKIKKMYSGLSFYLLKSVPSFIIFNYLINLKK
jgi:hypothetical protein